MIRHTNLHVGVCQRDGIPSQPRTLCAPTGQLAHESAGENGGTHLAVRSLCISCQAAAHLLILSLNFAKRASHGLFDPSMHGVEGGDSDRSALPSSLNRIACEYLGSFFKASRTSCRF